MPDDSSPNQPDRGGSDQSPRNTATLFPSTLESQLEAAKKKGDVTALGNLLVAYQGPLHTLAMGRGYSPWDAEDAVGNFIENCLTKQSILLRYERKPGRRFRSFLRTCFENFLTDQWKRENTVKRGRDSVKVPLEELTSSAIPADLKVPEEARYDLAFALSWWQRIVDRFRKETADIPNHEVLLQDALQKKQERETRQELSSRLGISVDQLEYQLRRVRERLQLMAIDETTCLVDHPSQVKEEVAILKEIFITHWKT